MIKPIRKFWRLHGHRLRVTRLALGISEAEAAEAYGVTVPTYRKWERGGRERGGGFLKFSKRYDVNLDWLYMGDASLVGDHLSKGAKGKVAILPVKGPRAREKELRDKICLALRDSLPDFA
jgi:transcriptional regulator with XRE-family HTH domain